jgi:hypothetical protein
MRQQLGSTITPSGKMWVTYRVLKPVSNSSVISQCLAKRRHLLQLGPLQGRAMYATEQSAMWHRNERLAFVHVNCTTIFIRNEKCPVLLKHWRCNLFYLPLEPLYGIVTFWSLNETENRAGDTVRQFRVCVCVCVCVCYVGPVPWSLAWVFRKNYINSRYIISSGNECMGGEEGIVEE